MEVFIKVMNGLVMTFKEDKIYMCLDALLCEQLIRCQDIDQVLLHEIIFFFSMYLPSVKC